jgi:hypothetical protein
MGTIFNSYARRDVRVRMSIVRRDDGLFVVRQKKPERTSAGDRWTGSYVGTFDSESAAKAEAKARADQPASQRSRGFANPG